MIQFSHVENEDYIFVRTLNNSDAFSKQIFFFKDSKPYCLSNLPLSQVITDGVYIVEKKRQNKPK